MRSDGKPLLPSPGRDLRLVPRTGPPHDETPMVAKRAPLPLRLCLRAQQPHTTFFRVPEFLLYAKARVMVYCPRGLERESRGIRNHGMCAARACHDLTPRLPSGLRYRSASACARNNHANYAMFRVARRKIRAVWMEMPSGCGWGVRRIRRSGSGAPLNSRRS